MISSGFIPPDKIKSKINNQGIDYILVSPLQKCIDTCLSIASQNNSIQIIIEPLLIQRIQSKSSMEKFQKIEDKIKTFKKPADLQNLDMHNLSKYYLQDSIAIFAEFGLEKIEKEDIQKIISKKGEIETIKQFQERINKFKSKIPNFLSKSSKKLAVLTHPSVLETLSSTGYHQDYSLINNSYFKQGDVKWQFITIQEIEGELTNQSLPFCS